MRKPSPSQAKWPREVCGEPSAALAVNPGRWDPNVLQSCLSCDFTHALAVTGSVGFFFFFLNCLLTRVLLIFYVTLKAYSGLFIYQLYMLISLKNKVENTRHLTIKLKRVVSWEKKESCNKKLRQRIITRFEYRIYHWFKRVDSFLNVIIVFEPKITSVRIDL